MLQTITKRLKRFLHAKRGISNVIVIMLSLILIVIIVSNVVLWSYQMNQLDWEKMQENIAITNVESVKNVWFYNPYAYSPWGATSWLSGSISDLAANDGNYMAFKSYYSGTNTLDFVDNNTSDVDSFRNIGTHGSFPAQQAGPDSVFDILTEESTGIVFRQVTVSSEQTTTNTEWTAVSGASVSFTPRALTEEWLILVTADIRSSSSSENRARFRYTINGVPRGETGVQQGTTSTTPIEPYNVYFHFSRITGVASQQTVSFQFQASLGSTAYARNIHILCIRLDEAGLEYTEINGDTSITSTAAQTLATLQFTPPSSGDYIVTYCTLVSELPTGPGGAETWLDYDAGTNIYPVAWSTPNTRRIHSDRSQFEPHGLFTKINLNTTQHTLMVQARLRTAGETSTARDIRIAAFRVDAFDFLEFDEDTAVNSTTAASTVRSVVNVANPSEQSDYLILAGIHTISSGTSSRESGGIEIDDVSVQMKGDRRLSYAEIARIAAHYAYVKTSSAGFKVETTFGTGGVGTNTIYSKQSVIYVLKIPKNYELDLEVQWTNVTYDLPNEELCIFGGAMALENLQVDVWNGSIWSNVFANLSSGWNNVSVSAYLTSSTFTIRFKATNETNDTTQDRWNIDAVLLHFWHNEYTAEVVFLGSSNTAIWGQLNWTVGSAWTVGSVNVTLQLYNYTLDDYSTSGNGYIAYTSNSTPNINENKNQTITVNPAHFRNATGQWRMKIRGVKATDTQFDLRVDLIEYKVTEIATRFTFKNKGSLTTHLVSLWIINSTVHKHYNINVFVNSGEILSYDDVNTVLPNGEYIAKVVTQRGNIAVFTNA
ncbi:hypothetical protein HXY32_05160 [Candidatus Bathyarchaeota archaeon]|nr:hypothetical protein [Candidatus Bathyarchaeota archaeon]